MVVSATGIKQQRPLRERSGSNAFHAEIAESMNAEIADYILLNSPRLCASAAKKSFLSQFALDHMQSLRYIEPELN